MTEFCELVQLEIIILDHISSHPQVPQDTDLRLTDKSIKLSSSLPLIGVSNESFIYLFVQ